MPVAAIAGPIVGGLISASASRSAASAAADAAQRATEEAAAARAEARQESAAARAEAQARLEPWRRTGEQANNRLSRMLGLDGQPASDFASEDPGYAFRLQEGQRQVDNSAAARGSTLSGAALKALQRYGQGMASQEFQNSYNRLANMSTQGQNSAVGQASNDMRFGDLQSANAMRLGEQQGANTRVAGDAYGAGQLGQANAWSGAIQGSVNQYQNNQLMNLISGGKPNYSVIPGSGSSDRAALYGNAGYG